MLCFVFLFFFRIIKKDGGVACRLHSRSTLIGVLMLFILVNGYVQPSIERVPKKELKGFLVGSRHKFHLGRQAFTSHGSCTSLVCNHFSEGFTPTDLLYGITRARFFNLAMLERKTLPCSTWQFIIYGHDFYSLREGAGSHW